MKFFIRLIRVKYINITDVNETLQLDHQRDSSLLFLIMEKIILKFQYEMSIEFDQSAKVVLFEGHGKILNCAMFGPKEQALRKKISIYHTHIIKIIIFSYIVMFECMRGSK